MLSVGIEPTTLGLWDPRAANCANWAQKIVVIVVVVLRQPGVEPGPHRWQRRILTVELLALIIHTHTSLFSLLSSLFFFASTGNRTRTSCLEGTNSNHWTIDAVFYMYVQNNILLYMYL